MAKAKDEELLDYLAKMCEYAQEHIGCSDAWPMDRESRENRLQCTSFAVACFLAQNTVEGHNGVEFCIVLEELAKVPKKLKKGEFFCRSEKWWKKTIQKIVDDLGGWK